MENELIKSTIKVGNSAGVLLPKEYLNTQVKIVLQPLDLEKDILDILLEKKLLSNVLGVYLTGSYARNEQTIESDIDVLVITDKVGDRIKKGKYDLMLVWKDLVDEKMKKNIFPLLPMMVEAKAIINKELLNQYKNTPITLKNIKWHIDTTKSAMGVVKASIGVSKELGINESDASAYSLILRLRTLYMIDCIRKKKLWTKKELLSLIKKTAGSLIAYEEYLRVKAGDKKMKDKLPIKEAESLMNHNNRKVKEIERWVKKKKRRDKKD